MNKHIRPEDDLPTWKEWVFIAVFIVVCFVLFGWMSKTLII